MIKIYIAGVEYRLSLFFPAVLVILLTFDKTGIPAWCIAASAMHEAGHFFAMFAFGSRPSCVSVGIFGVSVRHNPGTAINNMESMLIALAGPMVNLISFAVLFSVSGWTTPSLVHLVLAAFNLLPVEALDGGQALYFALAGFMDEERADRIVFYVSVATLVPLAITGFFLLMKSGYNYTLIAVCIYLGLLILFKHKR